MTNLHAAGVENPFYQPCHTHVLNPKSITMEELYGGINKLTLEWSDGLMAMTVRSCVQVGRSEGFEFNIVTGRGRNQVYSDNVYRYVEV